MPSLQKQLSLSHRPFTLSRIEGSLPAHHFFRLGCFSLLLYFLIPFPLFAEHTRRWRQSTYEEFLKGSAHGVAVRSDGRLELAPKFTLLADADASYLWSV